MPQRACTAAIVASSVDYGESDRVCTLLTRDLGKISVLAKAARRSRKRFGGALGLFVVGEATVRPTRGELAMLERFDAREDLSGRLSADVVKVAHGSYVLELARELWPPGQHEPELFELVTAALRALAASPPSPSLLRSYELKVLAAVGLLPAIDHCAACGDALAPGAQAELGFGLDDGGALCAGCGAGRPASRSLGASLHRHMVTLVRAELDEAAALRAEPEVARAARDLMLELTRYHLGKELRSLKFISQLAGLG